MPNALTSAELESMITGSGLTAADFARTLEMKPESLRAVRRELRAGKNISTDLTGKIRKHFAARHHDLAGIAADALAALASLIDHLDNGTKRSAAPADNAPAITEARALIAHAHKHGLMPPL